MQGYLQYLPEILRNEDAVSGGGFLADYLKIFQAMLDGRGDAPVSKKVKPLEARISAFTDYLDPAQVPVDEDPAPGGELASEFLDYLAKWVALAYDQNWSLDKRREWLRRIVPLYRRRGTKKGINEYLNMFVGNQARVEEPAAGLVVAVTSTVAEDTFVGEPPPYFFRVRINYGYFPTPFNIDEWKNLRKGTRSIVDLEKPAHTYYSLDARTPGIIVGGPLHPPAKARSTVGRDTLIWNESKPI